ncbi:MAG: transcription termination factor NusA [Candidatus Levybacteria bacterium]|nr:transcription termination factor NusA [Candidatus Levybacteria bacterium]
MPAVQRSEFSLALNQVANERGVDVSVVLETVKNAILAAYRKDHPGIEVEEYITTLNPNTGEAKIFHKDEDVTPPGFGRIAAQTAKQVILQKIREKEKEAIVTNYRTRIGTIVNGMVLKFAGQNVIVDIGKTEAIMPPTEQIPNEKYHLNQRLAVYLQEIRLGLKGEEIIVSRANNGLIEGLFKREVPEVAQGTVVIKTIAREPGNRSKVAVYSAQSGIDPVGSCVGQKGVRVQATIEEFGGLEKIDIIQWHESLTVYIANALSPAKDIKVVLDEEKNVANVTIPSDQLSLAIGGGGQNVRLASKLTGYRIEIKGEEPAITENTEEKVQKEEGVEKTKETKKAKKIKKVKKTKKSKEKVQKKETKETKPAITEGTEDKIDEKNADQGNS